jgi:hypothetical protein
MARVLDRIGAELRAFLEAHPVFFVATAPAEGHIDCSPEGLDTFRVLDDRTVDLDRVSSSCRYGVPRMTLDTPRDELLDWATKRGERGLDEYRADKNARSIDALPGLR